jgi:hypothetical protein
MAGEELFNKYQTVIFLAGSASAEFFADIALAPFEAVKVGGRGDQGGVEAGVWGGWKGRSGRGVGSRGVWGDGRFGGGMQEQGGLKGFLWRWANGTSQKGCGSSGRCCSGIVTRQLLGNQPGRLRGRDSAAVASESPCCCSLNPSAAVHAVHRWLCRPGRALPRA